MPNDNVRLMVSRSQIGPRTILTITIDDSALAPESLIAFPDGTELSYAQETPYVSFSQLLYALGDYTFNTEFPEEPYDPRIDSAALSFDFDDEVPY